MIVISSNISDPDGKLCIENEYGENIRLDMD